MDSMHVPEHKSDAGLSLIPLKRKKIADRGGRSHVEKEIPQPSGEPTEVAPLFEPKEGASSRTMCERESSFPNFGFLPTRGYHEMGILWSLVALAQARAMAGRSADDIEKALAVYLQMVHF